MNDYLELQRLIRKLQSKGYRIADEHYNAVTGDNGEIICGFNGNVMELIGTLKEILRG